MKRLPSVGGDFETGCHTHEANSMALTLTSNGAHVSEMEQLFNDWEGEILRLRNDCGVDDSNTLQLASLGWLLSNQMGLYKDLAAGEASSYENPGEQYVYLTIDAHEVIRDWFCWLHRCMVQEAKEIQLQNQ